MIGPPRLCVLAPSVPQLEHLAVLTVSRSAREFYANKCTGFRRPVGIAQGVLHFGHCHPELDLSSSWPDAVQPVMTIELPNRIAKMTLQAFTVLLNRQI